MVIRIKSSPSLLHKCSCCTSTFIVDHTTIWLIINHLLHRHCISCRYCSSQQMIRAKSRHPACAWQLIRCDGRLCDYLIPGYIFNIRVTVGIHYVVSQESIHVYHLVILDLSKKVLGIPLYRRQSILLCKLTALISNAKMAGYAMPSPVVRI